MFSTLQLCAIRVIVSRIEGDVGGVCWLSHVQLGGALQQSVFHVVSTEDDERD